MLAEILPEILAAVVPLLAGVLLYIVNAARLKFEELTGIKIDTELRHGLHEAITNSLTRVLVERLGLMPEMSPTEIVREARTLLPNVVSQVRATNPDAVAHFDLSDATLERIAASRIADAVKRLT